ncbi:MAG TPA: hypothetical protein VL096_08410 [Pirellulaceae bacterium]|nr:hypothetical protein [Pirellulaceae bacterium]
MLEFLNSSPQLLMIAGIGVVIWVLWRRSSKHFGRGGTAYKPAHRIQSLKTDRDLAMIDAPPELARWQVEMYDTARDLKGEIDTKLAVLQMLTLHANEATARLEHAIERAEKLGLGSALDPLAAIEAWDDRDKSLDRPPQAGDVDALVRHPQAALIYALADQGQDATRIAAQTGLPQGDVEMTLSLRSRE